MGTGIRTNVFNGVSGLNYYSVSPLIEDVSKNDAITAGYIHSNYLSQTTVGSSTYFGYTTSYETVGQTFLTGASSFSLGRIKVSMLKNGTPNDNIEFKVYASNKTTQIGSGVAVLNGGWIATSLAWYEIDFDIPVELEASTEYFLEARRTGALSTSNYYRWGSVYSDVYAGGALWAGTPLTEEVADCGFELFSSVYGYIKTDSSETTRTGFIGFARADGSNAGSVEVLVDGIMSGLSGLTLGDRYYTTGTGGEISNTVTGEASYIGTAVSTTELKMFEPKTKAIASTNLITNDTTIDVLTGTLSKTKEIIYNGPSGNLTAKYSINETASGSTYCYVYINGVDSGVAYGSEASSTYLEVDNSLTVETGDLIQLYARTTGTGNLKDFKLLYDVVLAPDDNTIN